MKPHECKFCNIASSDHELLNDIDRPIYEDDSFYAICSIGGFISGWTLIFPKQHTYNLSEYYSESYFIDFVEIVKKNIEREYGKCVVFEHGSLVEGLTSCGVNHAHLHIVPFEDSLEKLVQDDENFLWEKADENDLCNIGKNSEYLFCSDSFSKQNRTGLLTKLPNPQSQYFRKILANFYGIADSYSYKTHAFEEQSLHTYKRSKNVFCNVVND